MSASSIDADDAGVAPLHDLRMNARRHSPVRTVGTNPSRSTRKPAALLVEEFRAQGCRYRWREGDAMVTDEKARRDSRHRREALSGLFPRVIVPQLERRGARGMVHPAAPPAGIPATDLRWVAWHAPDDAQPVWGLYLAARHHVHEPGHPANDAFVLVAWGDGPALAWADEHVTARAALRAALRTPPAWLRDGMASRDADFPVRIDRLGVERGYTEASCVAMLRPGASRPIAAEPASADVLLGVLQAWKRSVPNG